MSQLSFNSTGITVPKTSDIRADIAAKVQAAFKAAGGTAVANVDPDQPLGQLVDMLVAEIEAKNAEVSFLANCFSLEQAKGSFLDALVSLYFVERKVSEPTIVQCTCTGLQGTVIPFGAVVQDTNGNRYRCLVTGATIGESGNATVNFSAIDHGPLEVQPETVTRIITTVPGWDSVTNPVAGVTGRDEESDAVLRDRTKESVALNSHGSVSSILAAVAQVDGVIDVSVLENITNEPKTQYGIVVPGHSIAVCVAGGEGADIAQAIYEKKDAGCGMTGTTEVTYTLPSGAEYTYPITIPTNTNVFVKVTLFTKSIGESLQQAIANAIVSDAAGEGSNPRVGLAQTLYGSRFWSVVLGQTNIPIQSVQVALGSASGFADSIVINANVEPVIVAENVSFAYTES
jgi:uncharacterized phage protein gp47/JayE